MSDTYTGELTPENYLELIEPEGEFSGDVAESDVAESDVAGADVAGADLAGADLAGIDVDVAGADVAGADLAGIDVARADIAGADLTGAEISGAPPAEDRIVLAQATTGKEEFTKDRDQAVQLYRESRNMPWFTDYMKQLGVESGQSASVATIAEAIDSGEYTPEEIIFTVARARNAGVDLNEMFYTALSSAPRHYKESILHRRMGRLPRDIALRDMVLTLAEDAGIPTEYIQRILDEPGADPNSILSRLTGAQDVVTKMDAAEMVVKAGGRKLGETAPAAVAGAEAGALTFRALAPVQLVLSALPFPLSGKIAKGAQVGAAATVGGGVFLGSTFLTQKTIDSIFGKAPPVTPRAMPWWMAGDAVGTYWGVGYPVRKALGALPENTGLRTVASNLDYYNASFWERAKTFFPGMKESTQNLLSSISNAANASWKGGPFAGIKGGPWALADKQIALAFGVGAGHAEAEYPGHFGWKISLETGWGLIQPQRLVWNLLKNIPGAVKGAVSGTKGAFAQSPSEKHWASGTSWLRKLFNNGGYTDEMIANEIVPLLETMETVGGKAIPMPAGTRIGSPELLGLQATLQQQNARIARPVKGEMARIPDPENPGKFIEVGKSGGPSLKSVLQKEEDAGITAILQAINVLRRTGSPKGIQLASEIERGMIEEAITTNLEQTIKRALDASARLGAPYEAPTTMEAGKRVHELLVRALEDTGNKIGELYTRAASGLNIRMEAPNLVSKWNELNSDVKETGVGEVPEVLMDMQGMKLLRNFFQRRGVTDEADQSMEVLQQAAASVRAERTRLRTSEASVGDAMAKSPEATNVVTRSLDIGETELLTLHTLPPDERAMLLLELGKLSNDYRSALGKTLSPKLDATTRNRVATLAEKISARISSQERLESAQNVLQTTKMPSAVGELESFEGPIGELVKIRSYLLDRIRTASANSEYNEARILGELQDAIQKDIDGLLEGGAGAAGRLRGALPAGIDAANETAAEAIRVLRVAQNAAKARHDAFSRTFASNVIARKPSGETRIPPEVLLQKLFGGGSNPTALMTRDIQKAVTFVAEGTEDIAGTALAAETRGKTLMELYDTMLRSVVTSKVLKPIPNPAEEGQFLTDAATGKLKMAVDQVALANVAEEYKQVLNMRGMEPLKALMTDTEGPNLAHIKALLGPNSAFRKSLEDQARYSAYWAKTGQNVSGAPVGEAVENPSTAIAEAIGDNFHPVKRFQHLLDNVVKGEIRVGDTVVPLDAAHHEQVMTGFRDAVMDWAWLNATNSNGGINVKVLRESLFGHLGRSNKSVMGMLRMAKTADGATIVDLSFNNNLKKSLRTFEKIKEASLNKTDLASVIGEDANGLEIFGLRMLGSGMGAWVADWLGRATLIAQSAGSKLLVDAVGRMPKLSERVVLSTMVDNPPLMAAMLRRGPMTVKQAKLISGFFGKVLGSSLPAALTEQTIMRIKQRELKEKIERVQRAHPDRPWLAERIPGYSQDVLRYVPPRPNVRAYPPSAAPAPVAPPPVQPAPAAAPPGGLSYQDVFPDDRTISPLLDARKERQQLSASQGIGSLA